jgi:hypothetical protein
MVNGETPLIPLQQLRQLRNIHRNPLRLILAEQLAASLLSNSVAKAPSISFGLGRTRGAAAGYP